MNPLIISSSSAVEDDHCGGEFTCAISNGVTCLDLQIYVDADDPMVSPYILQSILNTLFPIDCSGELQFQGEGSMCTHPISS